MIGSPANTSSDHAAPRVKAFIADHEAETVVRMAMSDLGIKDPPITLGNIATAIAALAKQPSPRLLIVDISFAEDPVARIRELINVCESNIGIVAVGTDNDVALYRHLKRAGVIEYFFKPLLRDQIARACHDVLTDRFDQPSLYSGHLIFVLGARGGVGATTIATNAAWYMAESRQRWTMLLDLDLQNGDAALQLDATPGSALREAFEHPERVDKLFLERGAIHVTPRLNLLASLELLGDIVESSEEAVIGLLEALLRRYRAVIVDLPHTIAASLPHMLQMPSTCALVGNATLTSAREMARWREFIGPNTRERRTLQVLNQCAAHGNLPAAEFTSACGQTPEIVIPYDRELAEATNFGTRAMQKCSCFRNGLMRMLHDITGEPIEKPASLFQRVFGG